ncbi:MAG: hypothetical protein L0K37_03875, partial [Corynebacterium casei]|uniref:hypothetical protein n=2 Tax=Corynebacterium casei TaxID=160386 RepID=UPI002647E767
KYPWLGFKALEGRARLFLGRAFKHRARVLAFSRLHRPHWKHSPVGYFHVTLGVGLALPVYFGLRHVNLITDSRAQRLWRVRGFIAPFYHLADFFFAVQARGTTCAF